MLSAWCIESNSGCRFGGAVSVNVITYSSLISACEKAGRWELALDLFGEMHREGCKPNVVTYNSLIAACAQGMLYLQCMHSRCTFQMYDMIIQSPAC